MAFFQAFFDESGKFQSQKVISFAGFIASQSGWGAFDDEWRYWLRNRKLSWLHVSKDNLKATATFIKQCRPFVDVIKKHLDCGFAMAVDVKAFEKAHKLVRKHFRQDPHYLVFNVVLRDVIKHVSEFPEPGVSIICDDEPSKACECYKMYDVMRQNTGQPDNRVMKSISFGDAKFYYALQAADLFAWVARAESLYRFFGEEFSLRELYQEFLTPGPGTKIKYMSGFWNEDCLLQIGSGLREKKQAQK